MDYEPMDYPNDDFLRRIRFMYIDIYEYKLIKLSLSLYLYAFVCVTAFQGYEFIHRFDPKYFVFYGPVYLGTFMVLISLVYTVHMISLPKKLLIFLEPWKVTSQKLKTKMERELRQLKILIRFNTVLIITACLIFAAPGPFLSRIVYIYEYVNPRFEIFVHVFFICNVLLYSHIVRGPFQGCIYLATHLTIQVAIFLDYVNVMDSLDRNRIKEGLAYDEEYQKQIKIWLKCVAERLQRFVQSVTYWRNNFKMYVLLYAIAFALVIVSFLVLCYTADSKDVHQSLIRYTPLLFAGVFEVCMFCYYGQRCEDLNVDILDKLCLLKWYNWNEENKKSYLIILPKLLEPWRVGLFGTAGINYEYALDTIKFAYSIASVLSSNRYNREYNDT